MTNEPIDLDEITIEDARDFISRAKLKRDDFLVVAKRSWRDIEKRNEKGRLYGGNDLDKRRMWNKFPLWWVTWKIRQPLTFARMPIPVLKDTQGDDPLGRTACVIGERLARGILKTFDAFPEFSAAIDDFLITNFGWGHWCYRRVESTEDEKIRLLQLQPAEGDPQAPPMFMTPDGQPVSEPLFDEFGAPYMLSGQQIEVENEEVYFEAGVYAALYTDADALRWNQVEDIAFQNNYSYREFIKKFGKEALGTLKQGDVVKYKNGDPITVYEYHCKPERIVKWFADDSTDFITPVLYREASLQEGQEVEPGQDSEAEEEDIFQLSGFFPCTKPLLINCSTTSFWPTPEFFQLYDILDDINQIVKRMILLTKAIRIRFFFDSSIPVLQQLIGETGEGGGIGVPNLEQALISGKGDLRNLVAYFPVDVMTTGLGNMYVAYDQRLNMYYQLTGMSELIRGQTSDVEKTFGERQLEGKFAMNRFEPFQRLVQEWIKENYELGLEMALKLFSDKSLDEYITPQTLDKEDKQRYSQALDLLKTNHKRRFRVDFETDSTIQINQEWKKKQAIDLANTLTKAMESVAKVAETQPELAKTELKTLKYLLGEFADGKLFVDELQEAIDQVIEKSFQPKPPEPNVDLERLKLDAQSKGADAKFKMMDLQMRTQIEYAKINQNERFQSIKAQLEQLRLNIQSGMAQTELQVSIEKIQNDIGQAWKELALKEQALMANIQSEVGKGEVEQFKIMLDARVKNQELSLDQAYQELEAFKVQVEAQNNQVSLQERVATEQRLQEEHQANMHVQGIDAAARLIEANKVEPPAPPAPAHIAIDASRTLQIKAPAVGGQKNESARKKKE